MVKHRQLARQGGAFGAIAFESSTDLTLKICRGFISPVDNSLRLSSALVDNSQRRPW